MTQALRPSPLVLSALFLASLGWLGCQQTGSRAEVPRDRLMTTWGSGPQHLHRSPPGAPEVAPSLLPMYGGLDLDGIRALSPAADDFVREMPQRRDLRRAFSEEASQEAIDYYLQDRYAAAMKRFNQAWLLDNENPEAFFGFALLYADAENFDEASLHAEIALALGLARPTAVADAALFLAKGEEQRAAASGSRPAEKLAGRVGALLDQSAVDSTGEGKAYVARNRLLAMQALGREDLAWEATKELQSMGEIPPEIWRGIQNRRARMGLSN